MKIEIKNRWTDIVLFACDVPVDIESGLQLRHALEKATAAKTYLRDADLRGAYLRDADLRGAYLSGADLRGAYLSGAYLRGAYLRGADLRGAYLSGADLRGAYLRGAYLRGADLRGAYLRGADLSGADLREIKAASDEEAIANLDRVREIVLDDAKRLNMGHWHGDDEWINRTCVEETLCGTTHCLAGWLQVCSTDEGIRKLSNPQVAGMLAAPVASSMFFKDNDEALEWLRDRKYAVAA